MKYTLLLLLFPLILCGQLNPESIKIPMRDGNTLSADLYIPSSKSLKPIILIQTPYNKVGFRLGLPLGIERDIESSPYIFVVVDWRCFYGSLSACKANVNRGEDGYDAIEWLAKQSWSNGKVATWGPSALGNIQFMTAKEKPPSLMCAVPVVASPQTKYQKYFKNGVALTARLQTLKRLFGSGFDLIIKNPYYSNLWKAIEKSTLYPKEIEIPMLIISGWFDINTTESLEIFDEMRKASPASNDHRLLIGPWVHGGVGPAKPGTSKQGDLSFPEAEFYNDIIANQFLAYHLLGVKNGWPSTDYVQYFQMGQNSWESSSIFPPTQITKELHYYLTDSNKLNTTPLSLLPLTNSYIYNPEDPSPTIGGKTLHNKLFQGPFDQSTEVESRNDVILFTSDILTQNLSINGAIKVILHVSSDRKDTDFAIRLTEVYPNDKSILLSDDIVRMRFRNGFTKSDEKFMSSDEVYEIEFELDQLAQTFLKGNRIRLIITSSNYPKFNRNMNNGDEMYPNDNLDTLVNPLIATNKIHFNSIYFSKIIFPVIKTSRIVNNIILKPDIYPNPSSGYVNINNPYHNNIIEIINLNGAIIKKINSYNGKLQISVEDYPNGIYFLKSKMNNHFAYTRFIVNK